MSSWALAQLSRSKARAALQFIIRFNAFTDAEIAALRKAGRM